MSEEDYTAMLSDVQWKPNRRVSRAKATTAAVFYALSIPSVCALPTSIANAHTTSSGESLGPLHQRVSAKPQKGVIVGRASWYGQAAAGHKTATGERLDPNKLTAATTQLPLKASALVTNLKNGRSVPVRPLTIAVLTPKVETSTYPGKLRKNSRWLIAAPRRSRSN